MSQVHGQIGAVVALVAAPMTVATPSVAVVESVDAPEHCVVETAPLDALARGARTEPRCYSTVTELLRSAGLAGAAETIISTDEAARRFAGANYLAYHYLDAGGAGGSLAVTGSCGSGIASLDASFNDKMSSTRHMLCGRIKHFADANAGGDHQITQAGFNALVNMNGLLNDRVTSIYYYEA